MEKDPALVEVVWVDAVASSNGWVGVKKAIKKSQLETCRTVGHLIHKGRKRVVVALTYSREGKKREVNQTIAIPRSWVLTISRLRARK